MEYSLASCRSVCDWAKQCLYHLTCRTGGWSVTWKRTNFSVALLPLGVGGTNVLAGIVLILWVWLPVSFCGCGFLLILWVWLPSHFVGVASCLILWVWLPVSFCGCGFLYVSTVSPPLRWYALMEIQLFTAVVLRMFDMELMDPLPTVVS